MQRLDPFGYIVDHDQEPRFQDYLKLTWRSMEKHFKIIVVDGYEVDDDKYIGFPEAMCLLHDFSLVTRTPLFFEDIITRQQIADLIPEIRERTEAWPVASEHLQYCHVCLAF